MMTKLFFRTLFLIILVIPQFLLGQDEKQNWKLLATCDSLNIKIIRISNCTRYKNDYFLVSGSDSIHFRYTDRCIENDPFEYKESVRFYFRQLDNTGHPEMIMEFETSGGIYEGYRKECIIFNIDAATIVFRETIEACGQHFYGEELGDFYNYKYELLLSDDGKIIVRKPLAGTNAFTEEKYALENGVFLPAN